MARVKIGEYIIDEDKTASTTTSVSLLPEQIPDQGWSLYRALDGSTSRVVSFGALVEGDDAADREAALDAIAAALDAGGDFIVEAPADTEQYRVSRAGRVSQYNYETAIERDGTNAIIVATLIYSLAAPPRGSGSGILNPDGLSDAVTVSPTRESDGTVTTTIQARFEDDGSDTAQALAEEWINEWEDPSNYPSWLSAAVVISSSVSVNEASSTTSGAAIAQVTLQTLTLGLSPTDSALANVRLASVQVTVQPSTIDQASGAAGPVQVLVAGSFVYEYERHKPFDSSGSPRPALSAEAIKAIIDQIVTAGIERAGQLEIREVNRSHGYGPRGVYSFSVVAYTNQTTILLWNERVRIRAESLVQDRGVTSGGFERYAPPNALSLTVEHTLAIQQLGAPPQYRQPEAVSDRAWRRRLYNSGEPTIELAQSDVGDAMQTICTNEWSAVFKYVPEAQGGGGGGSVAGPILEAIRGLDLGQ